VLTVDELRKVKTESEIADHLTEVSQKASEIEMMTFSELLFTMLAKYKVYFRIICIYLCVCVLMIVVYCHSFVFIRNDLLIFLFFLSLKKKSLKIVESFYILYLSVCLHMWYICNI
jgi:hypothetical protein